MDYPKTYQAVLRISRQLDDMSRTQQNPENRDLLLAHHMALASLLTYVESLRAAARSVLEKSSKRGGVPGLMAEFGSLTSAYNGTMTILDGESLP